MMFMYISGSLVKVTDERSPLLSSGACTAIGEIGRNGALPLPDGEGDAGDGEITKLSVVNNLLAIVRSGKENTKVLLAAYHKIWTSKQLLNSPLLAHPSRHYFQTSCLKPLARFYVEHFQEAGT